MIGSITASCGHKVERSGDLVSVIYASEHCDAVDGFNPCIVYVEYCPKCAEKARAWPEWFEDNEQAEAWLDAQPKSFK